MDNLSFQKIEKLYKTDYNELYDALYYYMLTYIEDPHTTSHLLFKDEVENYTGLRKHEDIVEFIINL